MINDIHYMVDIETLDTGPNAVITQLAVTRFTFDASFAVELFDAYTINLPVQPQIDSGASISASTLKWHMETNVANLVDCLKCTDNLSFLENLFIKLDKDLKSDAFAGKQVHIWANDPSFDLIALRSLFNRHNLPMPYFLKLFRAERSFRTIKALTPEAAMRKIEDEVWKLFPATHNAGDDVLCQIHTLGGMMNALNQSNSGYAAC